LRNNFLIVNFPQGAGGKFLSSILMASSSVAHYDPKIEKNKTVKNCLEYIQRSFTNNKQKWILTEPNQVEAWNLHFISSKYNRGDNLSIAEFDNLCYSHGTEHFKLMIEQHKKILIPWHKIYIPKFFEYDSKITILLDSTSESWFDTSLWTKHYTIEENKIKFNIHDPALNPKLLSYFNKFNNNMYSTQSVEEFYDTHILQNPDKQLFNSIDKFVDRKNNLFIYLNDLLLGPRLVSSIHQICKEFNLALINDDFILTAQNYWKNLHGH